MMMSNSWSRLLLLAFVFLCGRFSPVWAEDVPAGQEAATAPDKKAAEEKAAAARAAAWKDKVVLVPIKGVIAPVKMGGAEEKIVSAIRDAAQAKLLILEVDSPGGVVDSCDNICGALLKLKIPTCALVLREAISGGAMVSTACNKIYMLKGSRIGDVQPMSMVPGQLTEERSIEKIESAVRAMMAANARANGYPPELLEAMVSRSLQIYEVRFQGEPDKPVFLKQEQYDLLKKNIEEGIDKRVIAASHIVVEKDKLLALAAQDAQKYGIVTAVPDDEAAFYKLLEIDPAQVVRAEIPAGDLDLVKAFGIGELSGWTIFLLILCLAAGVAGALTELHVPGFGIPGAIGIIGFSSFFYILFMHNRASPLEIILFIVGLALLVVEIVVLPGFGVPGVLGVCLLLAGLGLALLPDFDTPYMKTHFWNEMTLAGGFAIAALVLVICIFIFIFERGDKLPFLKSVFLPDELPSGRAVIDSARATPVVDGAYNPDERAVYLGRTGAAMTTLRPAGKVKLDSGEVLDVVTGGEFIEAGAKVRVLAVDMNRVLVVAVS